MKTMTSEKGTSAQPNTRMTEALNQVLADSYSLLGLTHLAHWNVEGSDFFGLHKAFEEQYKELFEAVDDIAERVRAVGGYAVGGLHRLASMAGMEEFTPPLPQKDYVAALIVAHEKLLDDAIQARETAGQVNDLESQDLMIDRITHHEKILWMLKSFLK
jgi:starvation-inducible DNA-binding protein